MTCLDVRELLPELAVGVLSAADRDEVDRHLHWCAGCRKEAAELGNAAATIAFALPPVEVPHGLRDRIVERVKRAAGAPGTPRRARTAVASIVAAMVAVASLGWGAVMAGRADRFEERAQLAESRTRQALAQFQVIIDQVIPEGRELPPEQTRLGRLTPTAEGQGGAAVLQLVSPNLLDFTIVIVNGLDPQATERLPYHVELVNGAGRVLRAGRIGELDADGGAQVYRQFVNKDLTGYSTVRVVDAAGVVVLEGGADSDFDGGA